MHFYLLVTPAESIETCNAIFPTAGTHLKCGKYFYYCGKLDFFKGLNLSLLKEYDFWSIDTRFNETLDSYRNEKEH